MNDPLQAHAAAVARLARAPDDRRAQHAAVLALARLGATERAFEAYSRFGLDDVGDDEDILALKARLHKDRFRASGAVAGNADGRRSAELYRAAFERTKGTYSGINAATMARLTGLEPEGRETLARRVLERLPVASSVPSEERYHAAATRAEAYWLLGDVDRAERALREAIGFAPLDYISHAATLLQMRLIAEADGPVGDWLDLLSPPRPVCYAGHLWKEGEGPDETRLERDLTDMIQRMDAGFAYGALSAGADIVVAERLLDEGVSLHVCLPGNPDTFHATSVAPYGRSWTRRFETCLERASAVTSVPVEGGDFDAATARLCAEIAMGQAILQSRVYARAPAQLLVSDPSRRTSLTHGLAERWAVTGYGRHRLDVDLGPAEVSSFSASPPAARLEWDGGASTVPASRFAEGVSAIHSASPDATIRAGFAREGAPELPVGIAEAPPSGTCFLSDHLAAWLALESPARTDLTYAGLAREEGRHIYAFASAEAS